MTVKSNKTFYYSICPTHEGKDESTLWTILPTVFLKQGPHTGIKQVSLDSKLTYNYKALLNEVNDSILTIAWLHTFTWILPI